MKRFEINNNVTQQPDDLLGALLVASPQLASTPFAKTVVLILQHNDDGSFGVVLNRPATAELGKAWRELTGVANAPLARISSGGPIGGPVFALHQSSALGEMSFPNGMFLTVNAGSLKKLARHPEAHYRVFFGVSGWARGQLESEINGGAWFPLCAGETDIRQVLSTDKQTLWESSIRRYGNSLYASLLGIRKFPANPCVN